MKEHHDVYPIHHEQKGLRLKVRDGVKRIMEKVAHGFHDFMLPSPVTIDVNEYYRRLNKKHREFNARRYSTRTRPFDGPNGTWRVITSTPRRIPGPDNLPPAS